MLVTNAVHTMGMNMWFKEDSYQISLSSGAAQSSPHITHLLELQHDVLLNVAHHHLGHVVEHHTLRRVKRACLHIRKAPAVHRSSWSA